MCFLLFLEPSRCSSHAGVSRFLQLSCHMFHDLVHPIFANLWQSCHILALFSISFSVFVFLSHQLIRVVPLLCTGPLSSSILSTCPDYRNLNFSNLSTPVISRIFSLSILSFKVFPHINHISVIFSLLSSSTFNAQHSAP